MTPTPSTDIDSGVALLPELKREFATLDYKSQFLAQIRLQTIIAAIEAAATLSKPLGESFEEAYMLRIHRIEQMEAEIITLRAALKPFAGLDFGDYTLPQNEQIIMRFECSVREINAARAAMGEPKP